MSKLSNSTGALVLAGLTFLSGCRKEPASPSADASSSVTKSRAVPELKNPQPSISLNDLTAPPFPSATPLADYIPSRPPIRSTSSEQYARTKAHLDAFEKWLITANGSPVASRSIKRTPANDAAVLSLKYLLNDYNSLVPQLHPGEKSWKPLPHSGNFNDGGATEAMVKRTEKLLNLVSSGKAGREFFFALRDGLEEAYGAAPRLHKVLRVSLLEENKSIYQSTNVDPLKRYPSMARFCYEPANRLVEPPRVAADYQRNIQLVKEMQHCLMKLGYDFDVKSLKQTGIRDNATDEALKLFCKDFLHQTGPLRVDKSLAYQLASVSTGFDFLLGATLNAEYDGVPYSKDPYKSYCGLTQVTMQEWCRQRRINSPDLLDIKESLLRACFREVFIIPSGCEHLLVMSASPLRVKALELARLVADESYNRAPHRALKTVAYALGTPEAQPDKATMALLLHNPDTSIQRLIYGRAFMVGFNGGEYQEGLSKRLKEGSNYIASLHPSAAQNLITTGIGAGQKERARMIAAQKEAEAHAKRSVDVKRASEGKREKRLASAIKTTKPR
jgi:hypothetical protein